MSSIFFKIEIKKFVTKIVSVFLFLEIFFPVASALSASSDFLIQGLVGSDGIPPSVPVSLVAVPVATSQINLSWASSTDNSAVGGYQVWRGSAQIATTTIPSYEDTGLVANTNYTYYVTAFDISNNISASSSIVSTTTYSSVVPIIATGGRSQGSRYNPFQDLISSIEILPREDSVRIHYETSKYVRAFVKWGNTSSYELGSLVEKGFSRSHKTNIVGLNQDTQYFFTIEGEDAEGRYGTIYNGTFTTLPFIDTFAPANVSNLEARLEGNDVVLSWANPQDPDLVKIRVVGSDRFYPSDAADGWVVYEGLGRDARDVACCVDTETYYYTVFTYDTLGNISSGAVVSVDLQGESTELDPTQNEIGILFKDIIFIQGSVKLPVSDEGNVFIDGAQQFTIQIPYERLPEHLKTILVTLRDPIDTKKSFGFLLKVNKEKTAYESILAPLGRSGEYAVELAIFDFKTAQVGYTRGIITAHIDSSQTGSSRSGITGLIARGVSFVGSAYLSWFLLGLLLVMFVMQRVRLKRR